MKIIFHADGSVEFPNGLPIGLTLPNYQAIGENKFAPKFLPCVHRQNNCRMSPCGKRPIFRWHCLLFQKDVTVRTCENCNARQSR